MYFFSKKAGQLPRYSRGNAHAPTEKKAEETVMWERGQGRGRRLQFSNHVSRRRSSAMGSLKMAVNCSIWRTDLQYPTTDHFKIFRIKELGLICSHLDSLGLCF